MAGHLWRIKATGSAGGNLLVITAVGNKVGGNFAKAAERALLDKKNNRSSFKYSCRFCIPGNCNSRGVSTSMRGMYEN